MTHLIRYASVCVALALLPGCGFIIVHGTRQAIAAYTSQESEVNDALARYRALVLRMEPDKLAETFDSRGEVSNGNQTPLKGREAILTFFNSFAGFKILEYEIAATSTTVQGDKAVQKGNYREKMVEPSGETVTVKGIFSAQWSRQPDGHWLILRMHTALRDGSNRG